MSFKLVIGLFLLSSSFYLSKAHDQLHGDPCGPHTHCTWGTGLICVGSNNQARCACPTGPLTDLVSYNLVWDADRTLCVGRQGSACTGTRKTPVSSELKSIPCEDKTACIQIPGQPPGVGSCQVTPMAHLNGAECNATLYCDSSRGLICTNGTCACPAERPNTFPKYVLFWDNEVNNCLATIGTHCVGTRLFPSTHGERRVECDQSADCVDDDMATPGLGICVARMQNPGTTTTTTVDPTATTSSDGDTPPATTAGVSSTISNFATLISVMVIAFTARAM